MDCSYTAGPKDKKKKDNPKTKRQLTMLNKKSITIADYLILYFFSILSITFCVPADQKFRKKPLQNETYSGFISREFFQAIITVYIPEKEMPLSQLRKKCKDQAFIEKDRIILPYLVHAAQLNKSVSPVKQKSPVAIGIPNSSQSKPSSNDTSDLIIEHKENILLFRSNFAWFLDSMKLFIEDYSQEDKCIFIFRKIETDLYKKVASVKLPIKDKISAPPINQP